MKYEEFILLKPQREELVKSIIFRSSISVEDFYSLKLSEDDQLNFVYYLIEYKTQKPQSLKAINLWALALANHYDICDLSVDYLRSLKNSYLNQRLYKNERVSNNQKDKIWESSISIRSDFAKKTTDLNMVQKLLNDPSLKVKRSLLYNPFLHNQNQVLMTLAEDIDPKIAKSAKELLEITDLEVRQLCMTDSSIQFEIIDYHKPA